MDSKMKEYLICGCIYAGTVAISGIVFPALSAFSIKRTLLKESKRLREARAEHAAATAK